MKKKVILCFVFMFVFIFFSFPCYAQSSGNDQRIVGTWILTDAVATYTLVFNANGSGSYKVVYTEAAKRQLPARDVEETFTFGISLTGSLGSDSDRIRGTIPFFSPDGKTLIIWNNAIFRKR